MDKRAPFPDRSDRRKFISTCTTAFGSVVLLASPLEGGAENILQDNPYMTVGQVMDLFMKEVPGAPLKTTVDTLKSGSRETKVTGIVTTMFATLEVIQKAIGLQANFIIAHEPTFYNHLDDTGWLENDDVYRFKADVLKRHNIAVWRNHDYIHQLAVDGVKKGVVVKLGWDKYFDSKRADVFKIPTLTLATLIAQVKERLEILTLRYNGDLTQSCSKILLMPGASGGRNQIMAIQREKPDVVLCGEIQEWETAEYIRDARTKGQKISLVVLGHVASEEPGSEFLAKWLSDKIKGVAITHVPAGPSLLFT